MRKLCVRLIWRNIIPRESQLIIRLHYPIVSAFYFVCVFFRRDNMSIWNTWSPLLYLNLELSNCKKIYHMMNHHNRSWLLWRCVKLARGLLAKGISRHSIGKNRTSGPPPLNFDNFNALTRKKPQRLKMAHFGPKLAKHDK